MNWIYGLGFGLALAATACKAPDDKKDDGKTAENPTDPQPPAPPAPPPAPEPGPVPPQPATFGTLGLAPDAAFGAADASVSSLTASVAPVVGADPAVAGTVGIATLHLTDPDLSCLAENNEPVDAKDSSKNGPGGFLAETDPRYGMGKLFCTLAGGGENATSVTGAYFMPRVFACALKDMPGLVFDGAEHDAKLPITKKCFGSLVGDPDTGINEGDEIAVKLKLSQPATVAGWDYEIWFETTDHASEYRMLFKGDPGKYIAFSLYSRGQQSFGDDGVALSIDVAKGELRYVYRRDITDCDGKTGDDLKTCFGLSTDDQWQGTRNVALLAKGTLGTDAKFTALTHLEGAHAAGNSHDAGGDVVSYDGPLYTVKGTLADGMTQRAYTWDGDGTLATFLTAAGHPEVTASQRCFKDGATPAVGLCAGNEGLQLAKDADTAFFIHPGDSRHPRNKAWQEQPPLQFEAVDLSDGKL